MQKDFYFLSPVEVVKVTSSNLEEAAEWCGGSVLQTESRRAKDRMDSYVHVPTPEGTKISWAFPGMFITKRLVITMKNEIRATYAVFRRDYFDKNYFGTVNDAVDKTWEREEKERNKPKKVNVVVSNNVGEALVRAQQTIRELEAKLDEARDQEVPPSPMKMTGKVRKISHVEVPKEFSTEGLDIGEKPLDGESKEQTDDLSTAQFKHNHLIGETCVENNCLEDRYADGTHYFIDKNAYAEAGKDVVVKDHAEVFTDLTRRASDDVPVYTFKHEEGCAAGEWEGRECTCQPVAVPVDDAITG